MKKLSLLVLMVMAGTANASFLSLAKSPADSEGNCLPQVISENARLYGELESLDKLASVSEAQIKTMVKESQKLGMDGFKQLSLKSKATRAAIKKYADTYGDKSCKAMLGGKVSNFVAKQSAATLDKTAAGYEAMAESYLKSIARK